MWNFTLNKCSIYTLFKLTEKVANILPLNANINPLLKIGIAQTVMTWNTLSAK